MGKDRWLSTLKKKKKKEIKIMENERREKGRLQRK